MESQDKHHEHMRVAIELARQALDDGDLPFGAVITLEDRIIAMSRNRHVSDLDVTRHAELLAISEASQKLQTYDLSKCKIYVSSEPCTMCATAILRSEINTVIFGMTRDDAPGFFRQRKVRIFDIADDYINKPDFVTGILKDEAMELFDGINRHQPPEVLELVPRMA
jgi:tRNA(Arg) A34 adenosine deaminase TadA